MSHDKKTTGLFADALKAIIKSAFKLAAIVFAWLMKAAGIVLSKTGEAIEKIIIKKSS
jgi:ABC-type amino acid transport system permease subunit